MEFTFSWQCLHSFHFPLMSPPPNSVSCQKLKEKLLMKLVRVLNIRLLRNKLKLSVIHLCDIHGIGLLVEGLWVNILFVWQCLQKKYDFHLLTWNLWSRYDLLVTDMTLNQIYDSNLIKFLSNVNYVCMFSCTICTFTS
jgi:hypothetical protein